MNEFNIILNEKIVKGNTGETILELARRHHTEIPTLCHDPRLEPFTSCYLCVVEVEGMRGLQPACSTRITDGMKVTTDNDRISKARKTALDLLLSNHYADCVAPCKETCPAGVDVQGYISLIEKGMYHEAVETIKETNPLPAICGRVCVRPCEVACRRNLLEEGSGVGIDYLKRFTSDKDLESPDKWRPVIKPATGKRVAVIGAGPGGLSAAFFLRKEGHGVDIYEASPAAGGWLRYGIPEYRLPNDLLQKEVDNIAEMGVNIFYNRRLGDNLDSAELRKHYDALVLAIGSQTGTLIGCEGEEAGNVFPGIDFLKQMEISGERFDFTGKTVAVVGGGNTAMDCCRSSIRCGADKVYVIYRRTEKEMPANPIEIHESKLEGVEYMFLTNPSKVNADEHGNVKSITCLRMELGEPDASGRRRPVPVEGSEFDIDVDVILAAIGQKTNINFLEEMNTAFAGKGQLKATRWGDIEADKETLVTGIPDIFAAGDAVTGPATLIQAIGQARVAARSCHQHLSGLSVAPPAFEFISRRDHFREQRTEDYTGRYRHQLREEMPTLPPDERLNFYEVELGYASEEVAYHETQRCLECGCTEYYDCDLKRHATQYHAEQKRLGGAFKEYPIDFRHPFVEIDNNKCILCSRCIRICRELVGANALGLVNRGFETYVAPAMGDALQDTYCESCGMCITTCPTAAISENFPFKPGPVKLEKAETICPFCSIGCRLEYNHKNGFVMKVTTVEHNAGGNDKLCRFGKFGYRLINDSSRILRPLYKKNGQFTEISFDEAYKLIAGKLKDADPEENAFFAGARLTNEEIFLIQKIARLGLKCNNLASFHYVARGQGYRFNAEDNVPFGEIRGASHLYLLGSEINRDNPVAGYFINEAMVRDKKPVILITTMPKSGMEHKVDQVIRIRSYWHFLKALNYIILKENMINKMYVDDRVSGFEEYKFRMMKEDQDQLLAAAGISLEALTTFAKEYNEAMNAVIFYSEKELGGRSCEEVRNLAMLTGKLGKISNGIVSLKEKNNAQGLIDMGMDRKFFAGGNELDDPAFRLKLKENWGIDKVPVIPHMCLRDLMDQGKFRNMFIFGEDPVGCALDRDRTAVWIEKAGFVVVSDYFMTETASMADLVLPASLPSETGGTFTGTQKNVQKFEAVLPLKTGQSTLQQLAGIAVKLGLEASADPEEIFVEAVRFFPENPVNKGKELVFTDFDNHNRMFEHGCDIMIKKFNEMFSESLTGE